MSCRCWCNPNSWLVEPVAGEPGRIRVVCPHGQFIGYKSTRSANLTSYASETGSRPARSGHQNAGHTDAILRKRTPADLGDGASLNQFHAHRSISTAVRLREADPRSRVCAHRDRLPHIVSGNMTDVAANNSQTIEPATAAAMRHVAGELPGADLLRSNRTEPSRQCRRDCGGRQAAASTWHSSRISRAAASGKGAAAVLLATSRWAADLAEWPEPFRWPFDGMARGLSCTSWGISSSAVSMKSPTTKRPPHVRSSWRIDRRSMPPAARDGRGGSCTMQIGCGPCCTFFTAQLAWLWCRPALLLTDQFELPTVAMWLSAIESELQQLARYSLFEINGLRPSLHVRTLWEHAVRSCDAGKLSPQGQRYLDRSLKLFCEEQ